MKSFPLLLEYGGERSTGVPAEAETNSRTLCLSRHDPPRSNRIIVRKVRGLFELRSFVNGKQLELVRARDAQMVLDFVRATWPVGTIIQWIITPGEKQEGVILRAAFQLTADRQYSWLKRIPVGSRL